MLNIIENVKKYHLNNVNITSDKFLKILINILNIAKHCYISLYHYNDKYHKPSDKY